ncbi:MAG: response regulator transcription factor [Lachnospiraceae bacterium]|nr:response regulator transcription factor [Lachnospiraceae bacterium]
MKQNTILVVDDDEEIREVVNVLLSSEGYLVTCVSEGGKALSYLEKEIPDLVILDVMMPDMDGYEVCRRIREKSHMPILFLTAKSREKDLVRGYMAGGDDYLQKPFSYTELIARVGALLRRYKEYGSVPQQQDDKIIELGQIRINTDRLTVTRGGEVIDLTNTEYGILVLLAKNRGKIFSLQEIYEEVWGDVFLHTTGNTVMVHIKNLREKLKGDDQDSELIRNRWGKGYYID